MFRAGLKLLLLTSIVLSLTLTTAISAQDCDCRPGDANGDGSKNIADAYYLIQYMFKWGFEPTPYSTCSGDANNDGGAGVGDSVYLINYVFKHGPRPATCEEWAAVWGEELW